MMNEEEFIEYFKNIAIQSKEINHTQQGRKSFFYIENGSDIEEFDEAMRAAAGTPTLLIVADEGTFSDNNSNNHTQEIQGEMLVIGRKLSGQSPIAVRSLCLPIAINLLARMKRDSLTNRFFNDPKRKVFFRIDKIGYLKVGPMNLDWYGYAIPFTLTCPFSYSVNSGTWRDSDQPLPPVGAAGSLSTELD